MDTLGRAFADVMRSERLVRLLEMVRFLGNTMNAYSGSGAAACVVEAFTLDSLVRVCECVLDVCVCMCACLCVFVCMGRLMHMHACARCFDD
jgi:hypothetical protein